MNTQLIDLSIAIENDVISDPVPFNPKVQYFGHGDTVEQMTSFFPGLEKKDLPNGEGWALERIELITHNGTHLDAPYHYASTMNGGERAITIDEVPLEWCQGPGIKLDFRHFEDGYVVQGSDVAAELDRIEHQLSEGDIVLVNTRAGSAYGTDGYVDAGCGMGREATLHLLERGVHVCGTDAWSWDAPFSYTAKRWEAGGDPGIIWEGHRAGREIGYCHLEKLHNLEALPAKGFEVFCFPVKIRGASAGWTRAVARVPVQP